MYGVVCIEYSSLRGLFCSDILVFVYNETSTTEIYTYVHTLSLHDALPIYAAQPEPKQPPILLPARARRSEQPPQFPRRLADRLAAVPQDRKSTRLNSSH